MSVPPPNGGASRRFPIRFDRWYAVLSIVCLMSPSDSFVEVDPYEMVVRMAWAFRARVPRSSIAGAAPLERRPLSRGVHGLFGRWLVNGSGEGIVSIEISPPQRAWVLGFPVRLRQLMVSVDEPSALIAALKG